MTPNPLFNTGEELGTLCPVLPGPCVRISIPGLLLDAQSRLGQDGAEPAGDVHPDVIDLVRVLPTAPRAVHVGPVLQDLHSTAFPTCLLSALFLKGEIDHKRITKMFIFQGIVHRLGSQGTWTLGMVSRTPFKYSRAAAAPQH